MESDSHEMGGWRFLVGNGSRRAPAPQQITGYVTYPHLFGVTCTSTRDNFCRSRPRTPFRVHHGVDDRLSKRRGDSTHQRARPTFPYCRPHTGRSSSEGNEHVQATENRPRCRDIVHLVSGRPCRGCRVHYCCLVRGIGDE